MSDAMTGTVTGSFAELLVRGMRALRRSAAWWGFGIVVFAVVNAAFWPSLEGSDALDSFDDMADLLEAFGAQNLATPSGYLDGQMYALMLPLLLSGMAIAGAPSCRARAPRRTRPSRCPSWRRSRPVAFVVAEERLLEIGLGHQQVFDRVAGEHGEEPARRSLDDAAHLRATNVELRHTGGRT